MMAVLTEHWGGKWPFWISPVNVLWYRSGLVISVSKKVKLKFARLGSMSIATIAAIRSRRKDPERAAGAVQLHPGRGR